MGKYRKFVGLFLVIVATLLLVAWEVKGRETILMEEVLVAKQDVPAGEALTASMFRSVSVPGNAVVAGAVSPRALDNVSEKISAAPIFANAQLSEKHLREKGAEARTKDSFFVVRREWIYMRSSALRRGDYVDIVSERDGREFGRYKIAFVKNAEEKEVTEAGGGIGLMEREREARVDATSGIDHVEIIVDLKGYMRIKAYAESQSGPSLILVQRGGPT
ncbi:MAG: SAF domain-containing protein [Clostridiales Family XIII bacterium]|nr:SAF domain-containing protein [Clostridiales Family XIII bacterium]